MVVFILLTLLATPILAGEIRSQHYHIVPVNSTDLCDHYQAGSCLTLDQLSSQLKQTGDITLSFLPGDHLLTWDMTISGANEVVFSSAVLKDNLKDNSSHLPRITCSENKGIVIKYTQLFTMQGLVVYGCRKIGHAPVRLYHASAEISSCIFTNNSVIDRSGGALQITGRYQNYCIVKSCSFQFNKAEKSNPSSDSVTNGGALDVMLSTTTITDTSFIENSASEVGGAINSKLTRLKVSRCQFLRNTAKTGGSIAITFIYSLLYSSFNVYSHNSAVVKGGALYTCSPAVFESDCFHKNEAQEGSAVYLNRLKNTTFINCNFTENKEGAVYSNQGFAEFTGSNSFSHNRGSLFAFYSEMSFTGSTLFMNNTGDSGGAITSIGSTLTLLDSSETVISGNKARIGGGIYLKQSTLTVFVGLNVEENVAEVSGGGVYALQSTLVFGVNVGTIDNSDNFEPVTVKCNVANVFGGGLFVSESSINIFNSPVSIFGNIAQNLGGGIFLQSSGILIKSTVFEVFLSLKNNSAVKGGGLYVVDGGYEGLCVKSKEAEASCFLQTIIVDNKPPELVASESKIGFKYNTASETGSDVYGGLLDRCTVSLTSTTLTETQYVNGLLLLKSIAGFHWVNNTQHDIFTDMRYGKVTKMSEFHDHISSDPVRVCFCEDDVIDCDSTYPSVFAKKGERFTVSLVALDQVGKPVNASLFSSLKLDNGEIGRLKEGQQSRHISNQCIELEYNVYSSSLRAVIELYADGPCENRGISKQRLNIVFQPCTCPVGFERVPPNIDCSCDCDSRLSQYISNCSVNQGTVQENSNVWIEFVNSTNTTDYVTHDCPLDYCVEKPVNISLSEEDEQCAFNRTGTLCGECKEGLSLVFASSNCEQCSNYYLFLLLPFALAGIALVAFILILNMTVATGTIHGLIFYANILAANRSIFLPFNTANFLTIFISWLNLDLGIETCFYSGLDSYGKLLLQLVFPAYVFLLIAMIMVLCDCSQRIAGLFGKRNPEATLYTLVLLSYSKLIRLIITALQFTTISYPNGSKEIVWVYDANMLYFTASHIPRFIAAIMITLLGAVYTSLLLFGQLFNRLSDHRLMKWTTHKYYIHFLKAHHAPLCDKHRYWAGLLLLARLAHYLISAFVKDSIVILSAIFLAFSLLMYKQANGKMYRARWLDSLESLFLANLTVLGVSTYFVSHANRSQTTLAIVSMSVTFVAFLAVVLYHILQSCGVRPGKILEQALASLREHKRDNYEHVLTEENEEERWNDESLFEERDYENSVGTGESVSDRDRYITPPIIRSAVRDDQLREPALDDLIPVRPEDYVQCGSIQASQHQVREMKMFA